MTRGFCHAEISCVILGCSFGMDGEDAQNFIPIGLIGFMACCHAEEESYPWLTRGGRPAG